MALIECLSLPIVVFSLMNYAFSALPAVVFLNAVNNARGG